MDAPTTAVLAWFQTALPLLCNPCDPPIKGTLTERKMMALGHTICRTVLDTWGGDVPQAVQRAVEAADCALTAVQIDESPARSLQVSYGATAAHLVEMGRSYWVEDLPSPPLLGPEPSDGEGLPVPASMARTSLLPPAPRSEAEGLSSLRGLFFPVFDRWLVLNGISPRSEREKAQALRYALMGRWYGADTFKAPARRAKGRTAPSQRFWRHTDPETVGSLSWLYRWTKGQEGAEVYQPVVEQAITAAIGEMA